MRVGLLLGKGNLSKHLINAVHEKRLLHCVVYLAKDIDLQIPESIESINVGLGEIKKAINFLKKNNIDTITFAGYVGRPSLNELKIDRLGISWLKTLGWRAFKGDDSLLSGLIPLIEKEGFSVVSSSYWLDEFITQEGILSKKSPNELDLLDIKKGLQILRSMSDLDISQSIIVQNSLILGIEAVEGTSALIERCAQYKRPGSGGVLVKAAKTNQTLKIDMPTIGVDTIQLVHKSGFSGIALEAYKTQVIDKDHVIELCNEFNLFLLGCL